MSAMNSRCHWTSTFSPTRKRFRLSTDIFTARVFIPIPKETLHEKSLRKKAAADAFHVPDTPEELISRCGALVWKTAAVYLNNPEDIKECVNDVFLEFYLHKDQYDPQKGSLAAYLSAIARHKAIRAFRKNQSAVTASRAEIVSGDEIETLADPSSVTEQAEQRLDLEEALASLKPEDFTIIRMKYYDGMTIREIAEAMHLPYETVKKRHQRSLSRLRLLLTLALVLALTALLGACAYLLLRHIGVIPGFGLTDAADAGCYLLAEPVIYQNDELTVQITEAAYFDGELTVKYTASIPQLPPGADPRLTPYGCSITDCLFVSFTVRDENGKTLPDNVYSGSSGSSDCSPLQSEGWHCYRPEQSIPQSFLHQNALSFQITVESHCGGIVYKPIVFPIELIKAEVASPDSYAMIYDGQNGGILAVDSLNDDTLTLELYPVSNSFSKYVAALSLYNCYQFDDAVPAVLTNKKGISVEGILDPPAVYEIDTLFFKYLSWTFPGVTPGTWTLSAPS